MERDFINVNCGTNHILVFLGVLGSQLSALRFSPGYVVSHCHCTEETAEKTKPLVMTLFVFFK